MAIIGLICRIYPDLAGSRLAPIHFWLMAIGTPVMLVGIPLAQSGGTPILAVIGSFAVIGAMVLFLMIFAGGSSQAS